MKSYDREVVPPAPFVDLIIRHPDDLSQMTGLKAKIDTAADISAIPATLITQLGLPLVSKLLVEGYDGIPTYVATYGARFEIEQSRFTSQEIIAIPETYALLGRDILNYFYLKLNGPDLTFAISREPIS
ncbi:MAG: hypothetical protein KDF65_00525 [Anaerolineae bacterium]|nr:hypothetical protein [Anaerolineae bacterium]